MKAALSKTLQLDMIRGELLGGTSPVHLSPMEAEFLVYLHNNVGRLVPKEELLEQVWGYKAGLQSRAVDATLTRVRSKVESLGIRIESVRGRGLQLHVPNHTPTPAPAPSREVVAPRRELVGRSDDLLALQHHFQVHQTVVMVGPGGIGKTSLAHAWARPNRARWVDLYAVSEPGALRRKLSAVLDLSSERPFEDAVRQALSTPGALVLDNAEDLAPESVSQLGTWLEGASMRTLLTSQRPLSLPGAHYLLPQLAHEYAAQVVQAARSTAGLPPLDDDTLGTLTHALGGLPLALVVAAPVADWVTDPAELVHLESEGQQAHHTTAARAVSRSLERLSSEALALAHSIGLHATPLLLATLSHIMGASLGKVAGWARELRLSGLAVDHREGRSELLPAARALLSHDARYAQGHADAQQRYIRWLLGVMPSVPNLKKLRHDIERALPMADGEQRLQLLERHLDVLHTLGPRDDLLPEWERWTASLSVSLRGDVAALHGAVLGMQGDLVAADEMLHTAIDHITDSDRRSLATARLAKARGGYHDDAEAWAERALASLSESTALPVRSSVLTYAAITLHRSQPQRAISLLESAVSLADRELPVRAISAAGALLVLTKPSPFELDRFRWLLGQVRSELHPSFLAPHWLSLALALAANGHDEDDHEAVALVKQVVALGSMDSATNGYLCQVALRLLHKPELARFVLDATQPDTRGETYVLADALQRGDRGALAPIEPIVRRMGEAYLDGTELPPPEGLGAWVAMIRAGVALTTART